MGVNIRRVALAGCSQLARVRETGTQRSAFPQTLVFPLFFFFQIRFFAFEAVRLGKRPSFVGNYIRWVTAFRWHDRVMMSQRPCTPGGGKENRVVHWRSSRPGRGMVREVAWWLAPPTETSTHRLARRVFDDDAPRVNNIIML